MEAEKSNVIQKYQSDIDNYTKTLQHNGNPTYESLDIRYKNMDNGGKITIAPVDANLYSAGWNNLSPQMREAAIQNFTELFKSNKKIQNAADGEVILLLENFDGHPNYYRNAKALIEIFNEVAARYNQGNVIKQLRVKPVVFATSAINPEFKFLKQLESYYNPLPENATEIDRKFREGEKAMLLSVAKELAGFKESDNVEDAAIKGAKEFLNQNIGVSSKENFANLKEGSVIIPNSDFQSMFPKDLKNMEQRGITVFQNPEYLGWHTRKKDTFFDLYTDEVRDLVWNVFKSKAKELNGIESFDEKESGIYKSLTKKHNENDPVYKLLSSESRKLYWDMKELKRSLTAKHEYVEKLKNDDNLAANLVPAVKNVYESVLKRNQKRGIDGGEIVIFIKIANGTFGKGVIPVKIPQTNEKLTEDQISKHIKDQIYNTLLSNQVVIKVREGKEFFVKNGVGPENTEYDFIIQEGIRTSLSIDGKYPAEITHYISNGEVVGGSSRFNGSDTNLKEDAKNINRPGQQFTNEFDRLIVNQQRQIGGDVYAVHNLVSKLSNQALQKEVRSAQQENIRRADEKEQIKNANKKKQEADRDKKEKQRKEKQDQNNIPKQQQQQSNDNVQKVTIVSGQQNQKKKQPQQQDDGTWTQKENQKQQQQQQQQDSAGSRKK